VNGKALALYFGLSFILLSSVAFAIPIMNINTSDLLFVQPAPSPDLAVISANVTSTPDRDFASQQVRIPLEITIKNRGLLGVTTDFNVGALGFSLEPPYNVIGTEFRVLGERSHDNGGIYVSGLAAGEGKTFKGVLTLYPQPGARFNPGKNFDVRAMVDYNFGKGTYFYKGGTIRENNETNNCLSIETRGRRSPMWCESVPLIDW
jgi:hypothetical protein